MRKKGVRTALSVMMCTALILSFGLSFSTAPTTAKAAAFAKGADIGWLNQLENDGVKWQNDSGTQQDALAILKSHNIDSVRLRVFVNPPSNFQWTKNDGTTCYLGYGDKTGVVWMAQRAKNAGISRIMVDFHYSDHFADPAYQDIPSAWSGHSFSQLLTDVYNHTYEIMTALKNVGVYPEWVQIGNEITNGMLWPYGKTSNFSQLTQLINKGYDAVKAVSPSTKVVVQLDNGPNNGTYRWWFDNFKNNGGKWDVIGMSYYPYWNGVDYTSNINALAANLNDMASRYGKEVMICEVGGVESNATNSYNLVSAAISKVKAVPNSKGIGVFYWEPEANSSVLPDKYPLGATSKVSSKVLKFTTAIDAFIGQ